MKAQKTFIFPVTSTAVWVLALAMPHLAFSEPASRHNASALLDEAKLIDYEQRVAAKQTEMDRLNEDLKKGTEAIAALDKNIQKVGNAADDATKQLDQFTAQKKRATVELELLNLRIEAEKLKGEGLRMLQGANRKAQEAVAKRNEETDARTALVAAETRHIATKSPVTPVASGPSKQTAKSEPTLTDWRKKLGKAEHATAIAESQAREAMTAASTRLQQAEAAAARVEKKQADIGRENDSSFPGGNDPLNPSGKP